MDKIKTIDEIIVALDASIDQRGAQRALTICDVIQRLHALKAALREEDERVQGHPDR